jgi:uncharacterized coiled-coil DUF342 family protein
MDETHRRLENIEKKVDGLVELTVQMARVEERMLAYMSASDRLGKHFEELRGEVGNLKEKIYEVESNQRTSTLKINVGERIFWITVTGLLTAAITAILGLPGLIG